MIITQYGKDAIAAAAAGQTKISFTNLKTSDTGTLTTDTYPDFQSIKQSISPSSITMDSQTDTAKVAGLFDNNSLGMAYRIKAVGLYATCSGAFAMATPRLFAYELFGTPDFMPLPSESPTSYTYTFNTTINDAATVEVVIQPGDYALASDLQDVIDNIPIFGIIEATHTKSGTTHNLTVSDTTAENIKFKATDDFGAGDSIKINNVPYNFANLIGEDAFKTGNIVYAGLDNQNKTIQILNPGSEWYFCDKSTAEEVYAWLNAFPEGIHHVVFFDAASNAIGAVATQHAGLFYVLRIGNTYRKELNICNISSKGHQASYIGNVNSTTGAVVLSRVDNQIVNLPSEAQTTIQGLQDFIDARDLGHSIYYSSIVQSSSIGIPGQSAYTLDIRQTENNGRSCMIVATPWEKSYGKWILKKGGVPASWANKWTWEGEDMRDMIFDTTQGTSGFNDLLLSLQRGCYTCHANNAQATAAGLPSNSLGYDVRIEKITNSAFIVKATPWDDPSITYYTNQTYLTSGWKTMSPDVRQLPPFADLPRPPYSDVQSFAEDVIAATPQGCSKTFLYSGNWFHPWGAGIILVECFRHYDGDTENTAIRLTGLTDYGGTAVAGWIQPKQTSAGVDYKLLFADTTILT